MKTKIAPPIKHEFDRVDLFLTNEPVNVPLTSA
jgi:hypothetical protein